MTMACGPIYRMLFRHTLPTFHLDFTAWLWRLALRELIIIKKVLFVTALRINFLISSHSYVAMYAARSTMVYISLDKLQIVCTTCQGPSHSQFKEFPP